MGFKEKFLKVLEENPDGLTIEEICRKMGISRVTFYVHYHEIKDLVKERKVGVYRIFYPKK